MSKFKGKIKSASGNNGTVQQQGGGNPTYDYTQPYSADLGLRVDTNVDFNLVTPKEGRQLAVSVIQSGSAQETGTIRSVNADNQTGNIDWNGRTIRFDQPYLSELGLSVSSETLFTPIDQGSGQYIGVALSSPSTGGSGKGNGKGRGGK